MKRYVSFLMGILGFVPILAQQSDYYYYYKGNRIDLTVDSTRLFVVSEGEFRPQTSTYTRTAEYSVCNTTKSYVYNHVVPLQQRRGAVPEVYLSTLEVPEGMEGLRRDALMGKLKAEENVLQVLPTFSVDGEQVNVTNNLYVKLKSAEDFSLLRNMADQCNIEILGHHELMPLWYILSCNGTSTVNALDAANLFYSSGKFECCEPEFHVAITFHSDDPKFIYQWNLKYTDEVNSYQGVDINIEEAWEITKGDGAIVAVYDEAIYTNHPDLSDNILVNKGYDINTGTIPVFDTSANTNSHGTHSAGVIAAIQDNGIGLTGVAPESKIISIACDIDVNDNTWDKVTHATPLLISEGFAKAYGEGADVINCAWSCARVDTEVIDEALDIVLDKCVVVFAAGNYRAYNDNVTGLSYPADSNPRILTVGGMTNYGTRLTNDLIQGSYSFVGSRYGAALDVVAPAMLIYTTDFPEYYSGSFTGTSAACAHVSAIAALIMSAHPDLTPDQVVSIIEYTARKINPDLYSYQTDSLRPYGIWNEEMGYGLVDAGAAVKLADKAARTTYVKDMWIDGTLYCCDYDIEIENVEVDGEFAGMLEINKDHNVWIKKQFVVEKGATFTIFNDPCEETEF